MSPDALLKLLRSTRDGFGLPLDDQNVAATASLMLSQQAEIFYEAGSLQVRLLGKH